MRIQKTLLSIIFLIAFSNFGFNQESRSIIQKAVVLEVEQVSSYTYILIDKNNDKKWLAAPSAVVEIGDVIFYKGGTEMPDFKSKELDRTFASVLFLEKISKNKEDLENKTSQMPFSELHQGNSNKATGKLAITINPINDGISIAELLKNKEVYEGKTVKITGQVTKFNTKILGKNWLHLQDGTEFNGEFDLTFTTKAVVKVGDVVVLEGEVTLDKDFGHGYFYKVLVENTQLINK